MYKSFSMELAGRTLTVDVGRVAKQANGAAFMHYGDTVVLSTATASEKPRDGIDFFPLSVEYEEKMYAVGKIPGGFNKREGKASEHAILTSRVIDRPMRPLFPKDYRNDVTLNNMVMSVDPECDPEVVAMLGSAIATCISDIPFDGPCAMTQIGMIDGEFIVNPTLAQKAVSDLKLTVASTREKVIMIEADGRRLWRVLENLYNNAFKYALEGTRVYVTIEDHGTDVVFTIKNVSANPLNISPDELTERFVRGDVSRTTEGSGLGLSIAKDLTTLQGGKFELIIDGDLFKAQITFPIKN